MRKLIDARPGSLEPREVAGAPEPVKAGRTQYFPVRAAFANKYNSLVGQERKTCEVFPPSLRSLGVFRFHFSAFSTH